MRYVNSIDFVDEVSSLRTDDQDGMEFLGRKEDPLSLDVDGEVIEASMGRCTGGKLVGTHQPERSLGGLRSGR